MLDIKYKLKKKSQRRREVFKPEQSLSFGKLRSDHMFVMDYSDQEWHSPRIVPYGPFQDFMPGAAALHYGQEVFEGAKAFQHPDGEIYMFRLDENAHRLNHSAEIVCMPKIPEEKQIEGIEALLDVDRLWFPQQEGASLYIRPFMFATEDLLGVRASNDYRFCVILSPSGPYYSGGFEPIKLLITNKYHRAAPGGTGSGKVAGNYAASLRSAELAHQYGAKQVLYLDVNGKFLEEAGAMNHYQVEQRGEEAMIIIPKFTETILQSITSRSFLELGDRLGCSVRQEDISLYDFQQRLLSKRITEAGGLGTAAVVSPVGSYLLEDGGREIMVNDGQVGPVSRKMYELLTGIQYGRLEAPEGWLRKVERKK